MNIASTGATATAIHWCPNCDLPLRRRVNTLSGTIAWRTTSGDGIDVCPRCLEWLPTTRPEFVNEMNELLAEAGEPATCAEEIERWRDWQTENLRRLA